MDLFGFSLALALAAQPQHDQHRHAPAIGKVRFDNACAPAAQAPFQQGLAWLHSFEYLDAGQNFAKAAEADPDCAIAFWGKAMSLYHPLWAAPDAAELDAGRAAIASARKARSASPRERAYIDSLDRFFADSDTLDHGARARRYSTAMEALSAAYPDDDEAAVFHALSLIAIGAADSDPDFASERRAGEILNRVLDRSPDHPGVAHYLIHSFDYPALAELALPAARRYAGIAPGSPHAQHMPSHIFVRLGLWDEAIASNLASEAAAIEAARNAGLDGSTAERLHAMDYLAYAYLQRGQDLQAQQVETNLRRIKRADPPTFSVAYAATAIPARLALERRDWRAASALDLPANVRALAPLDSYRWADAHVHFARAVGAARQGDVKGARTAVATLAGIENAIVVPAGTYDWKTQVGIERRVAEGWLARAEGRDSDAVAILRSAADLDDRSEKHPVTPGAVLPAREQLGELLLELQRPTEALVEYEASLKRAPGRLAALIGAARSAKAAGDPAKAAAYYRQVAVQTADSESDRPEIAEARAAAGTR